MTGNICDQASFCTSGSQLPRLSGPSRGHSVPPPASPILLQAFIGRTEKSPSRPSGGRVSIFLIGFLERRHKSLFELLICMLQSLGVRTFFLMLYLNLYFYPFYCQKW